MRWKWIVGIVVGAIVALFVAVYAILSTYDFNELKPMIAQNAKSFTGRELRIGGDIELGIGLRPTLVIKDVGFQNAPWGSRPEMVKVKHFEVQVALFPLILGDIEIKRLVLVEPDILVETDSSGKSNLDFEPAKGEVAKELGKKEPEEEAELPIMDVRWVMMKKGQFTFRDGGSNKVYTVAVENLKATSQGFDSPLKLTVDGNYNKNPFKVSGTLGPFHAMTDPDEVWPLKLTVKAAGTTVVAEGSIKDVMTPKGIDFTVNVQGRSIPEIGRAAQVGDLPDMGPFKIDLKVSDPAPKTYKISDLKVSFQNNNIGGTADISLADKRPRLTAVLSSKKVDLRPLLPKEEEKPDTTRQAGKQQAKQEKVFPNDPLPFDLLNMADANVKIRFGQLLLPRVALNDLMVHMVLKNGRLRVKPLKSVIGGGTLDGQFDLRPQGKSAMVSVMLTARQIDLGRMLNNLGIKDMLEGKLDVDVELKGRGGSVATLMAGLNGKVSVVTGKGRINNEYVNVIGAAFGTGAIKLLNPFMEKTEYAELNCFVCRFDVKDGIADSNPLVFDSNAMSVVGDGKVNLKTEELDVSIKPSPKEGVGISGVGKIGLSLSEFAKPFKLGGTLANPSLAIDPTQTAITVGKMAGGLAFGPWGLAAALANVSSGDENPCLAAIAASKKGVKVSEGEKPEEKKGAVEKTAESVTKGVKDAAEGLGRSLKKLFGK